MTDRLYYEDAYLWEFDAAVTALRPGRKAGQWEAALDRSAFYPTSGGQPYDVGTLSWAGGEASVLDVEADRDLVGVLAAEVVSEAITRAVAAAESAYGFPAATELGFLNT